MLALLTDLPFRETFLTPRFLLVRTPFRRERGYLGASTDNRSCRVRQEGLV
jgi:hypothetical protein